MSINTPQGELEGVKKPLKEFREVASLSTNQYLLALNSIESNEGLKIPFLDLIDSLVKPSTSQQENLLTSTDNGLFVADKTGNLATLDTEHKSDVVSAINEVIDNTSNDVQNLQDQINNLVAASDVKDIVGTYQDLQSYDTSTLGNNDIIKVLVDSTHNNQASYYRWVTATSSFSYIGSEVDYMYMNTLAGSGTVALTDNSMNKLNQTGTVTFSLPIITDLTAFHQILVQITTSGYAINLGLGTNPRFFNNVEPDLSSAGVYNLYYEYDNINQEWVCGSLTK